MAECTTTCFNSLFFHHHVFESLKLQWHVEEEKEVGEI